MVKRLHKARDYQHPRAPIRLLANQGKTAVRRDMKASLKHLGTLIPTAEATRLIAAGRWREVVGIIDWGHFREVLKAPFDRLARLREAGAQIGVARLNRAFTDAKRKVRFGKGIMSIFPPNLAVEEIDIVEGYMRNTYAVAKDIGDKFNFDRFTPDVQASIRAAQDWLIGDLSVQARDTLEQIILSAQMRGLSPEATVEDIKRLIGLNDQQLTAAQNYERMLRELEPGALGRKLRDTAFDATIRDAIDTDTSLPNDTVDAMVSNYVDAQLDYRAGMIAQTEAVRAANLGLHDAYRQAIDRGVFPAEAVKRHWQVALDEKTCPVCLSIPERNPDGVDVDQPFESEDGQQLDPPVHPNCRCSVEYVTDLDLVPEDDLEKRFDILKAFDPNEPRDEHGRWTDGGGNGGPGLKASGLAAADAVKASWQASAPVSVDAILGRSGANQDALAKVGAELAAETGSKFKNPGPKGRKRIEEKIAGGRTPQSISDAVRGGFTVSTPAESDHIVAGLAKKFAVADEHWQVTPGGYFDRKVILRFPDGQTGEVQFWHPAMLDAKDKGGTKLYEAARNLPNGSTEKALLNQQMIELYGAVSRSLPPAWRAITGAR